MADYISRDSVLELTMVFDTYLGNAAHAVPVRAIKNIPSADVAEVRHGKWLKPTSDPYTMLAKCSVCGFDLGFITNFCANCGADMRGE